MYPTPQYLKICQIYVKFTNLYERMTEGIVKTDKGNNNSMKRVEDRKELFLRRL